MKKHEAAVVAGKSSAFKRGFGQRISEGTKAKNPFDKKQEKKERKQWNKGFAYATKFMYRYNRRLAKLHKDIIRASNTTVLLSLTRSFRDELHSLGLRHPDSDPAFRQSDISDHTRVSVSDLESFASELEKSLKGHYYNI